MNYIGGKYKLLPQIHPLFPDKINNFVDLFAGGCDVCANIKANNIYANDINKYIIEIYKEFQSNSIDDILSYIESTIAKFNLSSTNQEGYLSFREYYNKSKDRPPLDLFILLCFAFNYQCRFNNKHDFNSPFGKERSSFNNTIRSNLIKFHNNIKNVVFSSVSFREFDFSVLQKNDFVYADPPYSITTGSYNDGKRGFDGWSSQNDIELLSLLDELNKKGIKFALSNVIEHKNLKNQILIDWMQKYNIHYLNFNYKNSSYHGKNTDKETIEVLITNY